MRPLKLALVASLWCAGAGAVEYETRIAVEDEEDLYELLASEDVTEETFDALVELMRDKVDLCTDAPDDLYALPNLTYADVEAIVRYRREAAIIAQPEALVAAGVLDAWKLDAIQSFLLPCGTAGGRPPVSGAARAATLYTSGDSRVPAGLVEAKASALRHYTADAIVLLTRNRLADVRYDAARDALTAEAPATRFVVPKVYVQYDDADYRLVLGTFRAGFGQRLTFDTSSEYTPNGIRGDDVLYRATDTVRECIQSTGELPATPCPSSAQKYVTPDFSYPERLTGLAAGAKKLAAGDGWFQLYAFGSYQVHSIYQYEIYDRRTCADPRNDDDPTCGAPSVFARQEDLLAPAPTFAYQTLPGMWAEPLGGGNISYFWNRRTHVGVTGYGASPRWLVEGMDLDFQEWSRYPYGGAFGAVGADVAVGVGPVDLTLEVARSFDSTFEGGGFGAISRNTLTWDKSELELSLRYYDERFKNPYARSLADPDEVDGVAARDEAGGRIRFGGVFDRRLHLAALADFYVQPSTGDPKLRVRARADYDVTDRFDVGAWGEWKDKNLRANTGVECYETPFMDDPSTGEPASCTGSRIKGVVRVGFEPAKPVRFDIQGQLASLDDPSYPASERQDASVWLKGRWWVTRDFRIVARARYSNQALDVSDYLEDSVWGYVDVMYRLPKSFRLRARYDVLGFIDTRESTMMRRPNPEHWLRVEVQGSF